MSVNDKPKKTWRVGNDRPPEKYVSTPKREVRLLLALKGQMFPVVGSFIDRSAKSKDDKLTFTSCYWWAHGYTGEPEVIGWCPFPKPPDGLLKEMGYDTGD